MKKFLTLLFVPLLFFNTSSKSCEAYFNFESDGLTIHLDGSGSVPLSDISSWHWYINGDLFSDDGPSTHVTVVYPGEYELCLIIETASGCVDTFCHGVLVEEEQDDCEAHFEFEVDGFTIYLNGASSAGDVVHWSWYINGDFFSDDGPSTHLTVAYPGEYEICLIIETATGCVDTFCHGVWVEEEQTDCEAHFQFEADGFTIYLNGSSSSDNTIHWSWYINGDFFSDDGPSTHVTVAYPGEYEICLIIETATGCVDTFCHGVVVEEEADYICEAHFIYETEDLTIDLNGSSSFGDVVSWHWYSNGSLFSEDGPTTQWSADASDTYEICLVIETAAGCVDTFCDEIIIENIVGEEYGLKILPPAPDGSIIILLESPVDGIFSFSLYDLSGKQILEEQSALKSGFSQYTIPLGKSLSVGIYFASVVFNGEKTETGKLAVLK